MVSSYKGVIQRGEGEFSSHKKKDVLLRVEKNFFWKRVEFYIFTKELGEGNGRS